jgi:hypothetical protein
MFRPKLMRVMEAKRATITRRVCQSRPRRARSIRAFDR